MYSKQFETPPKFKLEFNPLFKERLPQKENNLIWD